MRVIQKPAEGNLNIQKENFQQEISLTLEYQWLS
jgi:hypothetical protein